MDSIFTDFSECPSIAMGSAEITSDSYLIGHVAHHFKSLNTEGNPDFQTSFSGALQRVDIRPELMNIDWVHRSSWDSKIISNVKETSTERTLHHRISGDRDSC